jgi:hypothetical protein
MIVSHVQNWILMPWYHYSEAFLLTNVLLLVPISGNHFLSNHYQFESTTEIDNPCVESDLDDLVNCSLPPVQE